MSEQSVASAPAPARAGQRRIQVRRSGIHGRGVFALQEIGAGEVVIEYKGEKITWQEADRRHQAAAEGDPYHTFLFQTEGGWVIDGGAQGNSARWINHSCEPNCEAQEDERGRIFIVTLHPIATGQELFFDYALELHEKPTKALRQAYACHCGTPSCRGTMLALPRKQVARKTAAPAAAKAPKAP